MLCFPPTFPKMLVGCECQELTPVRQWGNLASVYFTCTTPHTAGLLYGYNCSGKWICAAEIRSTN